MLKENRKTFFETFSIVSKGWKKYKKEGLVGVLKAVARRIFLPFLPKPPPNPVSLCLREILKQKGVNIVQIGAYIGDTGNDPFFDILVNKKKTFSQADCASRRIILVEPVKEYFEKLRANYGGTVGLFFENVAISSKAGTATFFRLDVDPVLHGFPEWLSQLGSLKKERMERLWDHYEARKDYQDFYLKHRVAETVECLTFQDLMEKHQFQTVDLLQMDVEGYEKEILDSIDFSKLSIRFINYECVLLQEKKESCEQLLRDSGYRLIDHGQDTFAYKYPDVDLVKQWFGGRY
jgi:FkbM family methyltransferase